MCRYIELINWNRSLLNSIHRAIKEISSCRGRCWQVAILRHIFHVDLLVWEQFKLKIQIWAMECVIFWLINCPIITVVLAYDLHTNYRLLRLKHRLIDIVVHWILTFECFKDWTNEKREKNHAVSQMSRTIKFFFWQVNKNVTWSAIRVIRTMLLTRFCFIQFFLLLLLLSYPHLLTLLPRLIWHDILTLKFLHGMWRPNRTDWALEKLSICFAMRHRNASSRKIQ